MFVDQKFGYFQYSFYRISNMYKKNNKNIIGHSDRVYSRSSSVIDAELKLAQRKAVFVLHQYFCFIEYIISSLLLHVI